MRMLAPLTIANLKSFIRDRAALFWTLAFPVVFVILFGTIFSGGDAQYSLAWVDQDGSQTATALREAFASNAPVKLTDGTLEESRARMQSGDVDGILVIPKGLQTVVDAAQAGQHPDPVDVVIYTDPSRSNTALALQQIATGLVMAANLRLSGAAPLLAVASKALQTNQQKLETSGSVMSDTSRAQLQKDIERQTVEGQRFEQDAQAELNELQQQLQQEFQGKLMPVLEAISKEKGLQVLFSAGDSGVIWAEPGIDLTLEAVKRLDAAKK